MDVFFGSVRITIETPEPLQILDLIRLGGIIECSKGITDTVSAAENQRNRLAEQLREQHLLAWERLRLAYEQYLTALDRAALTRRNYELATSRHSEGVLSSNRLMEIEATLNEAEAGLAAAEAGYYIARSAYLYASGADLMTEGF